RAAPSPQAWLADARRARYLAAHTERYEEADADYARALALGSPDRLLDWYRHCSIDCQAGNQWSAALWYLNRLIAAAPKDWQLYAQRSLVHDKLGQAKERDADVAQATERGADSTFLIQIADQDANRGDWDGAAAAF